MESLLRMSKNRIRRWMFNYNSLLERKQILLGMHHLNWYLVWSIDHKRFCWYLRICTWVIYLLYRSFLEVQSLQGLGAVEFLIKYVSIVGNKQPIVKKLHNRVAICLCNFLSWCPRLNLICQGHMSFYNTLHFKYCIS